MYNSCVATKREVMKDVMNIEKEMVIPGLCGPVAEDYQYQSFSHFVLKFYEKTE